MSLAKYVGRIDSSGAQSLQPADLREVTRLYRQTAGDLAYAKTFFGRTELTRFLNALVGRAHNHIYRAPERASASLVEFFRRGFPAAFQRNYRFFALSLYVFVAAVVFGAVAFAADERVAGLILGDELVNGVRQHHMWTRDVFAVTPSSVASARILTNNITVTIAAFGLGVTAGLGTFYVIALNGVMFGVVVMLTSAYGMSYDLWSFVGAHGFIELFVIILAGAGGFRMGAALLAPGDRPRLEALQEASREAVTLVLGSAPVLILAGIIEGYVSPNEWLPGWLKIAFGLALLAALVSYLTRPLGPAKDAASPPSR